MSKARQTYFDDLCKCWYTNGEMKRKDGPVTIDMDSNYKHWKSVSGLNLHRIGGPAYMNSRGFKIWWRNKHKSQTQKEL